MKNTVNFHGEDTAAQCKESGMWRAYVGNRGRGGVCATTPGASSSDSYEHCEPRDGCKILLMIIIL